MKREISYGLMKNMLGFLIIGFGCSLLIIGLDTLFQLTSKYNYLYTFEPGIFLLGVIGMPILLSCIGIPFFEKGKVLIDQDDEGITLSSKSYNILKRREPKSIKLYYNKPFTVYARKGRGIPNIRINEKNYRTYFGSGEKFISSYMIETENSSISWKFDQLELFFYKDLLDMFKKLANTHDLTDYQVKDHTYQLVIKKPVELETKEKVKKRKTINVCFIIIVILSAGLILGVNAYSDYKQEKQHEQLVAETKQFIANNNIDLGKLFDSKSNQ